MCFEKITTEDFVDYVYAFDDILDEMPTAVMKLKALGEEYINEFLDIFRAEAMIEYCKEFNRPPADIITKVRFNTNDPTIQNSFFISGVTADIIDVTIRCLHKDAIIRCLPKEV